MKNLIMFCKRYNLNYEVQNIICSLQRIAIHCNNYDEFSAVLSLFRNKRQYTVDSHYYTFTIWIYNKCDHDFIKQQNENKMLLVNMFYTALQQGKTQTEAKQIQYNYAVDNNMLFAFDQIYNN